MPVSAGTVQFSYLGDGITTVFPFPSRFLSNSDIIVGVNGALVASGFTATGQGEETGGNVTFAVAPLNGQTVTLIRAPAISQLLDFVNNQTILAENLDNGLDKLTIIAQYLDYLLERTLRLSQFDTAISGNFDLMGKRIVNSGAPVDANDLARLADLQAVVSAGGNVPSPTIGQIGYRLQALAAGIFGWVAAGSTAAPDGSLSAPGINFASETNTGFLRPSAGTLQAAILGVLRAELTASSFRLLTSLVVTNGTVTGGTNVQGQGPITTDQATVTSTPNNPSGVTLPTAVAGRRVVVANRGTDPINLYPATGASIGPLAANAPLALAVGQSVDLFARSATQWEGQLSQPLDADLTAVAALSTPGLVTRTGAGTMATRQITSSDGSVIITNPAGVAGDINLSVGGAWTTTSTVSIASGASADLSIPSTATEIWLDVVSLSTNGNDPVLQFLESGTPKTSGYVSAALFDYGNHVRSTSSFLIRIGGAARLVTGKAHLTWDASRGFWFYEQFFQENSFLSTCTGWGWCNAVTGLSGLRVSVPSGLLDGAGGTIQATYR